MCLQARMMSQAMRKLGASINKTPKQLPFLSTFCEKVGVMFGNPETTPVADALYIYAFQSACVCGVIQIMGTLDQ